MSWQNWMTRFSSIFHCMIVISCHMCCTASCLGVLETEGTHASKADSQAWVHFKDLRERICSIGRTNHGYSVQIRDYRVLTPWLLPTLMCNTESESVFLRVEVYHIFWDFWMIDIAMLIVPEADPCSTQQDLFHAHYHNYSHLIWLIDSGFQLLWMRQSLVSGIIWIHS